MKKEEIVQLLMHCTQEFGLVYALGQVFGNNIHVNVGFTKLACDASLDELLLSVRSSNALRRSNISTLGELIAKLNEGDLKTIRNLGAKSISEIKTKILVYGFEQLTDANKIAFFQNLIEINIVN